MPNNDGAPVSAPSLQPLFDFGRFRGSADLPAPRPSDEEFFILVGAINGKPLPGG